MDEQQSRAWLALVWTTQLLPAALDAQLQSESGMTHFEFMVLSALQQSPASTLRTTDLADAVNATMPRLSRVVGKLTDRGLVERGDDPTDARVVTVRLSGEGRRALVRAVPSHIALVKELVIDRLTRDQLDALTTALEPVVAALDPHERVLPPSRRD